MEQIITAGITLSTAFIGFMSLQMWNFNAKLAVIIEKLGHHDEKFETHEERINHLDKTIFPFGK